MDLDEAASTLRRPGALEEIAGSATPVITVDVGSTLRLDEPAGAALIADLASVRAITVAVIDRPVPRPIESAIEAFDIVIAPPDVDAPGALQSTDPAADLAAVSAAVAANPQASVALVQLLRMAVWDNVAQGLAAESFTYSTLQSGPEFARWLSERGPATVPHESGPPVLVERIGTRLEVTLHRPERANAYNSAMRDALIDPLRLVAVDKTLEGLVLRGAGSSFCSGGDLAEFGTTPDPATGHLIRTLRSPALEMHRVSGRARAHVHGACVGAGIELPAFAGTLLAAPDTRIRMPEIAMGLVPGAGGTVSITRRIGPKRTAYLTLTGAELDAAQALQWGLIDRIEAG